jgi:hypothetical protein
MRSSVLIRCSLVTAPNNGHSYASVPTSLLDGDFSQLTVQTVASQLQLTKLTNSELPSYNFGMDHIENVVSNNAWIVDTATA